MVCTRISLSVIDSWFCEGHCLQFVCALLSCLLVTGLNPSAEPPVCYHSCHGDSLDCSSMNISSISSLVYLRGPSRSVTDKVPPNNNVSDSLLNGSVTSGPRDQHSIRHLCFIKVLNLENNLISTIQPEDLKHAANVEYLDLNRNVFSEIPPGVFNLPSLISLNISWNLIRALHNHSFSNLPNLRILDLTGNPLVRLDQLWFEPLHHLLYLNLSKCDITIIPEGFGATFLKLKVLDISENEIRSISGAQLENMDTIYHIDMEDNPFHCDCDILDLQTWMYNNSNPEKYFTCSTPESLRGQNIIEIQNLCNVSSVGTSQVRVMVPIPTWRTQLPYDPMMGIGTAAVLSGMLLLFLLCVLLDKLKRTFKQWLRQRSDKHSVYSYSVGHLDSNSKLHTFPGDAHMKAGQSNCEIERKSPSVQSHTDVFFQKSLCLPRTSIDGKTEQYHSAFVIEARNTETHL